MRLYILDRVLGPTGVPEASTQQTFVDILNRDVIKPLRSFMVSNAWLYGVPCLIWDVEGKERRDKEADEG
jgi:hypothetical protein